MGACTGGAFGMFAMKSIRRRNVNDIDLLLIERVLKIFIGVCLYPIALRQLAIFLRVTRA
jgi:hypothetical protein